MSTSFDCVIAGAGVIGLAIGRRLAKAGLAVAVLESEQGIGEHTSSRNSEVIHAGLYYPAGSLKAKLCVSGKWALYDYCREHGVAHQNIGKLIVATSVEEEAILASIDGKARANGVDDLELLSRAEIAGREPAVRARAALYSPSTGIVDSHAYMLSLQAGIEQEGGVVVTRSTVAGIHPVADGFEILVDGVDEKVTSAKFVNAAGLWAPALARQIDVDGLAPERFFMARGHYFSYTGRSPFRHLVYPVPIDGGLGIHATNDLAGCARFGPDAEWIDEIDYQFPAGRKDAFVSAIRRYFPDLDVERLNPSYTGIRPKLYASGEASADFRIDGPADHDVPGLVNLFGIESPGLTASLAIADYVASLLDC